MVGFDVGFLCHVGGGDGSGVGVEVGGREV